MLPSAILFIILLFPYFFLSLLKNTEKRLLLKLTL